MRIPSQPAAWTSSRTFWSALTLTLSALLVSFRDTAWTLEPATLTSLEIAAHALAKSGRELETRELLRVLVGLGYPKDKLTKLASACAADASKVKSVAPVPGDATRRIRAAAKQMAAQLPLTETAPSAELARLLLRLDDSIDGAQVALGREKEGESWITADDNVCRSRRAEITATLLRARQLEIDITVGESRHSMLAELFGEPGVEAKCAGYSLHTPWSAEKTTRILSSVLRACAFSTYLRTGKLEVPKSARPIEWVLINTRSDYPKAVEFSLRDGGLDAQGAADARRLASYHDARRFVFACTTTESEAQSALLVYANWFPDGPQTALTAGHLNWVSMVFLGAPLPGWAWSETSGPGSGGAAGNTSVVDDESAREEREEHMRLARAGIVGCRSYMSYLAERGEDPPWAHSMLDQLGKIRGEDLLKTTSVVEFLQERAPLAPLIDAVGVPSTDRPETIYARVLGESLGEFEARWRSWLVPPRPGLVQRLEQHTEKPTPASRAAVAEIDEVLRYLNKLRASALKGVTESPREITVDASLSKGARMHVAYLSKHPEQAEKWPDAHEEYVDRDGFTPEGAWAGGNGVIHPGAKTVQSAIDGWMGTFYHRLPLLDPGLMRIGWGFEKSCAVLDVGSLCAPADRPWSVAWPFDGMTAVPILFAPELPNPVPGEDQSKFGYPITLQVGLPAEGEAGSEISMRLLEGSTEIACHFSSPNQPTNPELVPKNAYCLIPKAPLKPNKLYTVQAEWTGSGRKLTWSFRT